MYLHYNSDGSIKAVINLRGKKIKMTFETEERLFHWGVKQSKNDINITWQ